MDSKESTRPDNRKAELELAVEEIQQILSKHQVTYAEWISMSSDVKNGMRF